MNLREAWKLSKAPYVELTYRSVKLTRGSGTSGFGISRNPAKLVNQLIRSGRINKIVFTFFICVLPLFTLLSYVFRRTPTSLAGSVTLGLSFSFAYVLVYLLQVLTSLSGGESFVLLSTLPLTRRDFSFVSTLSVLRTLDYMVVGAVTTQGLIIGFVTGSVFVGALMVLVSLVNIIFAITIGIWLSLLFYRNITRGGRSRRGSLTRAIFLLGWGLVVGSIWFSFSFISTLLTVISDTISTSLSFTWQGFLLSILYPFSAGILVSGTANGIGRDTFGTLSISALGAFLVYLVLAIASVRWTTSVVSSVIHGEGAKITRQFAKEFSLKIRSPITGYLLKDLRVASKNPSTAFIFALPLLETLLIGLNVVGHTLRAMTIITATVLGSVFTLFSATGLLNTEGAGLDYTLSLPISSKTIIRAKSFVATATYTPVLVVILILASLGTPSSWVLFLIPVVEVPSVLAGTGIQLSFFIKSYKTVLSRGTRSSGAYSPRGLNFLSAGGLIRFVVSLVTAGLVIIAPIIGYTVTYFLTASYLEAIYVMTAVSIAETVTVQAFINRS